MSLGVVGGLFGLIAGLVFTGPMDPMFYYGVFGPRAAVILFSIIGLIGAAIVNKFKKLGSGLMLVNGLIIFLIFGVFGAPSCICLSLAGVFGLTGINSRI